MKCPVCGKDTGVYYWPSALDPLVLDVLDMPLYQRTYVVPPQEGIITCHVTQKGQKPISPCCEKCYDKGEWEMTQPQIGKNLIEAVRLERERDPQARAADIARHLDKSREAIRQALVKLELPTKFSAVKFCTACGNKLSRGNRTDRCRGCFVVPEVKDVIVRDYLRGDKPATILLEHKIGKGVLYRVLHKRNVKLRRR